MFGDSLSLEKFFFGIHFEYKTQIIAYWSKIKITLEKNSVKIYRWFIFSLFNGEKEKFRMFSRYKKMEVVT